jgi:hypothetical protein
MAGRAGWEAASREDALHRDWLHVCARLDVHKYKKKLGGGSCTPHSPFQFPVDVVRYALVATRPVFAFGWDVLVEAVGPLGAWAVLSCFFLLGGAAVFAAVRVRMSCHHRCTAAISAVHRASDCGGHVTRERVGPVVAHAKRV